VRASLGTPLLSQLVAARLLDHAADAGAARRAMLVQRLDRLDDLLRRELPGWRWERPAGGLSVWVELPYRVDGVRVQGLPERMKTSERAGRRMLFATRVTRRAQWAAASWPDSVVCSCSL
jgi:DNA-binding transcriptional MocR family regulator